MRFTALILTMFLVSSALAGEASLTWTNPTQYTDSTKIPVTCPTTAACGKLAATHVEYGSCNGVAFGTPKGSIVVPAPGTSAVVSDLVPEMFCFRAFARDDRGVQSAASNIASKQITSVLTAAVGAVAYSIKPDYASFGPMQRGVAVGTVNARVACVTWQRIAGTNLYRVPKAAVTFTAAQQNYVVAECS